MKDQDLSQVITLICIMLALIIALHVMSRNRRNMLSDRIAVLEMEGGGE